MSRIPKTKFSSAAPRDSDNEENNVPSTSGTNVGGPKRPSDEHPDMFGKKQRTESDVIERSEVLSNSNFSNTSTTVEKSVGEFPLNETTERMKVGVISDECLSMKCFTWKVSSFFSLPQGVNVSVDSPTFTFADAIWCLRLYPSGTTAQKSEGFLCLSIVRLRSLIPEHHSWCCLAIMNSDGEKCGIFRANCIFQDDREKFESLHFFKRSNVLAELDKFAPDDTVTLYCQICIHPSSGTVIRQLTWPLKSQIVRSYNTLSHDFNNLLLSEQDYDLTLKVKDEELRAHQIILRARSHVFDSMLSYDMVEGNNGVVHVSDCDPRAFKQFLLYLYTGVVDYTNEGENNMLELYYIADKYDMAMLKEECRESIKKSLSSRVICDVIQLAVNHSDSDLLECATDYFAENLNKILPTVEWQSFVRENSTQANELFIKSAKKWDNEKNKI